MCLFKFDVLLLLFIIAKIVFTSGSDCASIQYKESSIREIANVTCLSVQGYIRLEYNHYLKKVDGFASITKITKYLWIIDNNNLTNVDGFSNVKRIGGGLKIMNNDMLLNVDGFWRLGTIAGLLTIDRNRDLGNVNGFSALLTINGNLLVSYNEALANVDGFMSLTHIFGGCSIINNNNLTNVDGFASITFLKTQLSFKNNKKLTSIRGFNLLKKLQCSTLESNPCLNLLGNPMLNDISGFSNLNTIGKDLWIKDNAALTTFSGFSKLETLDGSLHIYDNLKLANVDAFSNIQRIPGNLIVYNNDALTNVNGFSRLISIGGELRISDNYMLSNISCFTILDSIGADVTINMNELLEVIDSFSLITHLHGQLFICENNQLKKITGFSNLKIVQKDIIICSNNMLQIFNLSKITSFTHLNITNNNALENIYAFSQVISTDGNILISNNNALVNVDSFSHLESIHGNLDIHNNDALANVNGFSNLKDIKDGGLTIRNNDALTSLDGFMNIETIDGDLNIDNNAHLTNIKTLWDSIKIKGDLTVDRNNDLEIVNLGNVNDISGNIAFSNNPNLLNVQFSDLKRNISIEGSPHLYCKTLEYLQEYNITLHVPNCTSLTEAPTKILTEFPTELPTATPTTAPTSVVKEVIVNANQGGTVVMTADIEVTVPSIELPTDSIVKIEILEDHKKHGVSGSVLSINMMVGNETVRDPELVEPIIFTLPADTPHPPACHSSCREGIVCSWWDAEENCWSDDGCDTQLNKSDPNMTKGKCTCSHLTDFAMLLSKRGSEKVVHDSILDQCTPRTLNSYVLIIFVVMYALLLIWCVLTTMRLILHKRTNDLIFPQHILFAVICLCRALAILYYIGVIDVSVFENPFITGILLALPHLLMFWVFTLMAFHWMAMVHFPMKSTKGQTFKQVKPLFLIVNFLSIATTISVFIVFLTSGSLLAATISQSILSFVYIFAALLFLIYARKVGQILGKSARLMHKMRSKKVTSQTYSSRHTNKLSTSGYKNSPRVSTSGYGSRTNSSSKKDYSKYAKTISWSPRPSTSFVPNEERYSRCCKCSNLTDRWMELPLYQRIQIYGWIVWVSFTGVAVCSLGALIVNYVDSKYVANSTNAASILFYFFDCIAIIALLVSYIPSVFLPPKKSTLKMRLLSDKSYSSR